MSIDFVEKFAQKLIASDIANVDDPLVGCTAAEIDEIERKVKVTLPAIYREYLSKMGRSPGDFLRGEECCYPELTTLTDDGRELLSESGSAYKLQPTAFVFWMSQGTQFSFFDTKKGNDPPIYHYREDDPEPLKRHEHFSEYMEYMLANEIAVRDRIKELDKKQRTVVE